MFHFFRISTLILLTTVFAQAFEDQDSAATPERSFALQDFSPVLPARPLRPIRPIPLCQVDPAIENINFQILYKTSQFRGKVRITAIVKNKGVTRYTSGPNQQTVLLYEGPNLVARQDFQNLEAGQTISLSFDRLWDASSPSEGEFPPEYKALIIYDPDILLDGNKLNDDCRNTNNQLIRSGSGINSLF